jgi:ketosteroid isomerase-like protein
MKTLGGYILLWGTLLLPALATPDRQLDLRPGDLWMSALSTIVDAEKAFCRAAVEKGTREAFLAYLTEDAVMFRPQPVPGKKWWLERQAPTTKLSWRPVFADVSAAGDLGYTTGPFEVRTNPTDPAPASYGNYVTIWQRQPDSTWKVLVDLGTANPAPARSLPDFNPKQAKPVLLNNQGIGGSAASNILTGLDRKLAETSTARGPAAALRPYLAKDVRLLRADRQPMVGGADVGAALPAAPGSWTWEPARSVGSISGDLGYTYGAFQAVSGKAADSTSLSGYYLRIWKKQPSDEWRIVLDIAVF